MRRFSALIALIGFASTSNAVVVSDQTEAITQYLIMSAPTIRVTKTSDPNTAEIILKPTGHNLVSISPTPFSRNIPVKGLTKNVWNGIFESKSIPASLTWTPKNSVEQGVFLSISLKDINEKAGIITLKAMVSSTASLTLADKAGYAGNPIIYGILKNASITLDDQQGRVIRGDDKKGQASMDLFMSSPMDLTSQPQAINGCVIQNFTSCPRADLAGANLSGIDLSSASFIGANLSGANLSQSNLTQISFSLITASAINLSGASLKAVNFTSASMGQATLSGAKLSGCNLANAQLANSQFNGANLVSTSLANAVLNYANFSGASISNDYTSENVEMQHTNFSGVHLSHVLLRGVVTDVNLTNAVFSPPVVFSNYEGLPLPGAIGCATISPPITNLAQMGCKS